MYFSWVCQCNPCDRPNGGDVGDMGLGVCTEKKLDPVNLCLWFDFICNFFIFWPFLWQNTWRNIIDVVLNMSNNPVGVKVLFGGITYDSRALPASYLPALLLKTITEPAIILILVGFGTIVYRFIKNEVSRIEIFVPLVWFFAPFLYVLFTTPPMYDNYRHFLFILPAAFLFSAFAIDFLIEKIKNKWFHALVAYLFGNAGYNNRVK